MSDSRIGIELDGTRATLVAVVDGAAVYAKTFTETTQSAALTAALSSVKRSDHVRIALVTPGSSMRRLDVTAAMLASRAEFEDAVYTEIPVPRDGTTAAGLFFDPAALVGSAIGPGVGAVAPADPVEAAYASLGKRRVEIVPPAFTFAGHDGLHLTLRASTADLTLVVDGRPVAHRQMRAGGLDVVAALLGDAETDVGDRRLAAALTGDGAPDPIAANEVDRYLRKVAAEVRDTRDHWVRSGESAGTEVTVTGPGATSTGLEAHLRDVDLTRSNLGDLNRALSALAPQQRANAVPAYLAAVSAGDGLPAAAYPNPYALADAETAARRSKLTRQLVAVLAVVAAAALAAGVPILRGAIDVRAANASLNDARVTLNELNEYDAKLAQIDELSAVHDAATADDVRWSQVIAAVYATAGTPDPKFAHPPIDIVRLSVDTTGSAVTVDVTATYPAPQPGAFHGATTWMRQLQAAGAAGAVPDQLTNQGGKVTVVFDFTLPADQAPYALNEESGK